MLEPHVQTAESETTASPSFSASAAEGVARSANGHVAPHARQVPLRVAVVLASQKQPIRRILKLAPGTLLRLDKPSHAPLTLEVSGRRVARGIVASLDGQLGLVVTQLERKGAS